MFLVDAREPAHQGNGVDGAEIELEPLAAAHGAGGAPHGGGVTVEGPGGAGGALAGGGAEGVGVQLAEGLRGHRKAGVGAAEGRVGAVLEGGAEGGEALGQGGRGRVDPPGEGGGVAPSTARAYRGSASS